MKYNLFLDDIREPNGSKHLIEKVLSPYDGPYILDEIYSREFIVAKNYDQFVECIDKHGMPEYVLFDHDLGEDKTGYDCAKYLVDYCIYNKLEFPDFCVHSANPVGRENIIKYIINAVNRASMNIKNLKYKYIKI